MNLRRWIAALLAAPWLATAAAAAERWTSEELALLASLRLSQLPPAPRDPSNAVEDLPAAIELGRRLFFDTRLSRNGRVACASCHDPAQQFQDGRPVSQGIATGTRRAMPLAGAAHSPWLFWDGRKDSLWSQALGPLEDAAEHGSNRLQIAQAVAEHHAPAYTAVFGPLPDLAPDGASHERVSRVFANVGKAIAAYEKTLRHQPSRLDRYIETGTGLDTQEVRGLRLFIGKGQCVSCHNGPLLSDQHFHNTGVPPRDAARPDRGRAAALARVVQDEFNCLGRFSDARPEQCGELRFLATDDEHLEAAFKTPGLRDVASRAPYMHAGQIASLEEVVRHYVRAPRAAAGHSELNHGERKPIRLSEAEQRDLVAFLHTLSAADRQRDAQGLGGGRSVITSTVSSRR